MNNSSENESTEDRLSIVLGDYLEALRNGNAPSKQELLKQHPDLANDLRTCFASMDFLNLASANLTGEDASLELDEPSVIGDFSLMRELGRGGMGVVYEAMQLSLNRRVALKILPLAGMLDERQKARFQNEARAVGLLVHENIVPIYQVGADRGIHYYAMQYVDGRTVADLINDLKDGISDRSATRVSQGDPSTRSTINFNKFKEVAGHKERKGSSISKLFASTNGQDTHRSYDFFRVVAKIGIQAASALHHAHQAGVIHRDVKPTNLLIDENAKIWVADFGLALIESDAGLTCTGDVLGTARYMSPEQARGDGVIDHRTDVFSLGMTLYELATLQHASPGDDRLKIIRQISEVEPKAPRLHNDRIPSELETIILKSLEKDPAGRYESAAELANDLQRFLDHRPILAKRPSLAQRANKWTRRNRAVFVTAIVSAFLLLATVTGVSLVAMNRLRKSERESTMRLYNSFLQRAAAKRNTKDVDRRSESLASVTAAVKLMKPLEIDDDEQQILRVRNAMISSVTIPIDVRKVVDRTHRGGSLVLGLDSDFSNYARLDRDRNLVVRRLEDNQELTRLPPEEVKGVLFAMSNDGRYLAYLGHSTGKPSRWVFRVWDRNTSKRIIDNVPTARTAGSHAGRFSGDSRHVWFATGDYSLTAYSLPLGREVQTVHVKAPIECFSVSSDGRRVAVGAGNSVSIFDVHESNVVATTLPPLSSSVKKVQWGESGRYLGAVCGLNRGHVWDVRSSDMPPILSVSCAKYIVFNASETMLATIHVGAHTSIWNLRTSEEILSVPGRCTRWSNGNQLATNTGYRTRIWEIKPPDEFRTYQAIGTRELFSACTMSHEMVVAGGEDGLSVWSRQTGALLAEIPTLYRANVLFHEPSGSIVTNSRSGVQIWPVNRAFDQVTLGPPLHLANNKNAHYPDLAQSHDGSIVAALIDAGPKRLALYDIIKQNHLGDLPVHNTTRFVSINFNGTLAATGAWHNGGLWIWDIKTRKPVQQLGDKNSSLSGQFSPDGKWLVVASGKSYVLHRTDDWTEQWQIESDNTQASPRLSVFTPDSEFVAIRTNARTIRLVRVSTGNEVASLDDASLLPGVSGTLSADGRCLIEPVFNLVKMWDIAAIRDRLVEVGLDWQGPPLPPRPALSDHVETVRIVEDWPLWPLIKRQAQRARALADRFDRFSSGTKPET